MYGVFCSCEQRHLIQLFGFSFHFFIFNSSPAPHHTTLPVPSPFLLSFFFFFLFFLFQALAVTRVSISPIEGGPNDVPSIHSQNGIFKNRKFSGSGSDTDIITSSARAYVSALNKLLSWNARRTQKQQVEEDDNDNGNIGNAEPAEPMQVTHVQ